MGPVPRKFSDAIWKEFQEACSIVYDKKRSEDDEREKEFEGNYEKKLEILAEIKTAIEGADLSAVRTQLNGLEKAWSDAGRVPRSKMREVENAYRNALQSFEDKEKKALDEKLKALEELTDKKAEICRR